MIPSEFTIWGIFMPPLLVASVLGVLVTTVLVKILNRYRLSRLLFYPPLAFLALSVIFTCLIGTFIIPI